MYVISTRITQFNKRDSSIAEELAALVEEAEKEDAKSVELPAMF